MVWSQIRRRRWPNSQAIDTVRRWQIRVAVNALSASPQSAIPHISISTRQELKTLQLNGILPYSGLRAQFS